ncbi:MAG: hypothetical protein HY748_06595 [Elusimicrobia bacterium]|nr:hypothetical protein [Elusimicrobiota bacterium]
MTKPGKAGLSFFKSVVEKAARAWRLDALSFSGSSIEFTLARGPDRLSFEAVPSSPEARPCMFSGPGLGLNLRDAPEAGPGLRALAGAVFSSLSPMGFGGTLRRLETDALLYSDSAGPRPQTRLERYFRLADHTGDWWKFLYRKNDFLDQEVRFGSRCFKVNHGSWECRFNTVDHGIASTRFFADSAEDPFAGGVHDIQTGIGEADVAGGGSMRKLAGALRDAARARTFSHRPVPAGARSRPTARPAPKAQGPDYIHLNTTCLPELLGEDPRPLIAEIEKESKVPVFWTSKTQDSGRCVTGIIRSMLDQVRFERRRDPRSVIVAAAGPRASRGEARRLLEGLGLRVAGFLYPEVDPGRIPGIESCGALVWVNPAGWERISDEPFLERGFRVVRYHPPFGVQGTEAWLDRVRRVLGLRRRPARSARADAGRMARLRRGCRRWRAALIGDPADIELLSSGERGLGFSAAGLLAEMGFQVRRFVFAPKKSGAGRASSFATRVQLDRLLREEADLAFSHFNHDPRLASCGVAGFCETAFSIGVSGLVDSGLRLGRLAESRPFPAHRTMLPPWT